MSIEEEIEELKSLDELIQQPEVQPKEEASDGDEKQILDETEPVISDEEEPIEAEEAVPDSAPEKTEEDFIDNSAFEEKKKNVIELINEKLDSVFSPNAKRIFIALIVIVIIAGIYFLVVAPKMTKVQEKDKVSILDTPVAQNQAPQAPETQMSEEIIVKEEILTPNEDSMSSLAIDEYGRSNPFLPEDDSVYDMRKYGFDIMAPPESLVTDSQASHVMATKISGIMYDLRNPAAILNIEGEDYFVHSGDYINNYRILAIGKDVVTVQLGQNIYKARVGELITDGTINYNKVYDLENKFGGARK